MNRPDNFRDEDAPGDSPLRESGGENEPASDRFESQDTSTWSIELGNPPSESPLPPLRQRALHGISWNFAAGFGNQAIHFVIGILIARTLSPQDFGLMGMIAIFVTLTRTLADGGFGAALIQKRASDDVDASSVFYLNLLASTVLAAILWGLAGPVAQFYRQPVLEPMMHVMAMAPVLTALGRVHAAFLAKRLDFRTQFRVSIAASLVSGLVGLGCALAGLGVWSLVLMVLVNEAVRSGLYWWLHRWRPRAVFSYRSIREMSAFGFPLLGSQIISAVAQDIYSVVIGRLYSAADVGLFTRARNLQRLPVANLTSAVGTVAFPAFAEVQDDPARIARGLRQAIRLLAFVVFPIVALIAGSATALITVLLTEKWIGCVPLLRLMCFAELLFPLSVLNLNVIKARGKSQLFFGLSVVKQTLAFSILAVTCRMGIEAIVIGQAIAAFLAYCLNSYYSGRVLEYSAARQLRDVLPFAALAAVAGVATYAWEYAGGLPPIVMLPLQIATGGATYVVGCWLVGFPELHEALRIVRSRFGRRRTPVAERSGRAASLPMPAPERSNALQD